MKKTDTFTLRIPHEQNEEIRQLANALGMSQNALVLLSVNTFRESYAGLISENQEQFLRFLAQNQQPNA